MSHKSLSNLPTPPSDVGENHPPSPSEDFTSYSQLVMRMAKSLQLDIEEPPAQKKDLVFDDLNQDKTPPLSSSFIPAMLDLVKESWYKPPSTLQISW